MPISQTTRQAKRWSSLRLLRTILCCLALAASFAQGTKAAENPSTSLEYRVKAAYLLNFTKFITWPDAAFAAASAPFTICVVGEDPFGESLTQIVEGETVSGRKLQVERMRRTPPAKTCQVVFASRVDKELQDTLHDVGPGVLTVGDEDVFLRAGGMIGFVVENHRVRFDINQAAAENAGLTVSSKLLNVARAVRK